MRKKAFTLVECLITLIIIGMVSVSLIYVVGAVDKAELENSRKIGAMSEISSIAEQIKNTPTLENVFSLKETCGDSCKIKVFAAGQGEIEKNGDGTIQIISAENDTFSHEKYKKNIYRIVIEKDGQSVTTIIYP